MPPRFVQIHFLTPWTGVLLNRDDAGFAKRIPVGGVERTRVSSQCLKRHWRMFEGPGSFDELELPQTVRSRRTFEQQLVQPLVGEGVDLQTARFAVTAVRDAVLGKSAKASKKTEEDEEVLTGQVTVLGRPEIEYLLSIAREVCEGGAADAKQADDAVKELLGREGKTNLKALTLAGGLGAALFGRMVTSDNLARGDAAVHVAHAFTVHEAETETDYFSAIDDLRRDDGELGSGHIGNTELTTGLFYGYVVVDLPLLVSNLSGVEQASWQDGDLELAGRVVERLVRLIATVTPGAKLGSTAPYSAAHLVLVEAGSDQPRSLANAFLEPVALPRHGSNVIGEAYQRIAKHLGELDRVYEPGGARAFVAVDGGDGLGDALRAEDTGSLMALAGWARDQLEGPA